MSNTITIDTQAELQNAIAVVDAGSETNALLLNIGPLNISAATSTYVPIGGLYGTGAVVLGNHTLVVNDSGAGTYSGVISGAGQFRFFRQRHIVLGRRQHFHRRHGDQQRHLAACRWRQLGGRHCGRCGAEPR